MDEVQNELVVANVLATDSSDISSSFQNLNDNIVNSNIASTHDEVAVNSQAVDIITNGPNANEMNALQFGGNIDANDNLP